MTMGAHILPQLSACTGPLPLACASWSSHLAGLSRTLRASLEDLGLPGPAAEIRQTTGVCV
jgi:hypothetical protein